ALPVAAPALRCFVHASVERQTVTGLVLYNAGLLVEENRCSDRTSLGVAGDGDLHFQMPPRNHPAQKLQRLTFGIPGRLQWDCAEPLLHECFELLPSLDRLDLSLAESAADDEAHSAAVPDQTFHTP